MKTVFHWNTTSQHAKSPCWSASHRMQFRWPFSILWFYCVKQPRHPWRITQSISKLYLKKIEDLEDLVLTWWLWETKIKVSCEDKRTGKGPKVPDTDGIWTWPRHTIRCHWKRIEHTLETHWKHVVRVFITFFKSLGSGMMNIYIYYIYTKRKICMNQKCAFLT